MAGHGGVDAIVPRMRSHGRSPGRSRPPHGARAGVTLVELLVALVLVTIGLLALAGSTAAATSAATRGARQSDAAVVARARMESLAGRRCATIAGGAHASPRHRERWLVVAARAGAKRLRVEVEIDAPGGARRATLEGTIPCAE